jgi:HKD family nuclease
MVGIRKKKSYGDDKKNLYSGFDTYINFKSLVSRLLLLVMIFIIICGIFYYNKPISDGMDFKGERHSIDGKDVTFLCDLTYLDDKGVKKSDQVIFDKIFYHIDNAETYILIDMFLFNSLGAEELDVHRNISSELREKLIEKKRDNPDMQIDFITDDINNVYGGITSKDLSLMREARINVIVTDLDELRDSNPIYSSFYRGILRWFGNSDEGGIAPNPFSRNADDITIRSYFRLLNFKANHRKAFVSDYEDTFISIVTSANPHDASSAHSNVALLVKDKSLAMDIYETEKYIAEFSGSRLNSTVLEVFPKDMPSKRENNISLDENVLEGEVITEKEIKRSIMKAIEESSAGYSIDIAVFYISDRDLVTSLINASGRGVDIRIILDPNKDAFGYKKPGIPNRQIARELIEETEGKIKVRWYDTHGEQFHTKMFYIKKKSGKSIIILGSANFTKRNFENKNLELDIKITGDSSDDVFKDIEEYFDLIWENKKDRTYTADFSKYDDDSNLKMYIYRFQEWSGMCSY